jgi:16S rRNA (uracil1498-N3)-methyltransferase
MGHEPHLFLPGPWDDRSIDASGTHRHHLTGVLRLDDGSAVSYTDGAGLVGTGRWVSGVVERGEEVRLPAPRPTIIVAVAAPDAKERQRYLVEKLSELGVARIRWLRTRYGGHRIPRPDRAQQWADAALEQSRGAHRTEVDGSHCAVDEIERPAVAAEVPRPSAGSPGDRPAGPPASDRITILVGPEGGWAPGEIDGFDLVSLGERVLRVETAAVLAAFAMRG